MKRLIALFECEDAKKWEGYTELLWKAALQEPGDQWTIYKACEGHLPTVEEAAQFDGIIVAGSHYSAYEEREWINKLLDLLPKVAALGVRMYGCCFGCQILARALGGAVGPNPDGNFVLTIEQIQPTKQLQQFQQLHTAVQQALADGAAEGGSDSVLLATENPAGNSSSDDAAARQAANDADDVDAAADAVDGMCISSCSGNNANSSTDIADEAAGAAAIAAAASAAGHTAARAAAASGCFRLVESHGDQVLQLPPGATLLASSATATNELWCYGSNVLASQFHVEFDEPLVLDKIWASLRDAGRLNQQQAECSRQVLEAGGQMNANMLQVIKHFLKNGIDTPASSVANSSSNDNNMDADGSSNSYVGSSSQKPAGAGNSGGHGSSGHSSRRRNSMIDGTGASSGQAGGGSSNGAQADSAGTQQQQQQERIEEGSAIAAAGRAAAIPAWATAAAVSGLVSPPLLSATNSSAGGNNPAAAAAGEGSWPTGLDSLSSIKLDRVGGGSRSGQLDPEPSGCSSPTAASEHSVATATGSVASTSSAVPFSRIAYQRRQQKRELELHHNAKRMVNDAAAAFDMRMEAYSLDFEALQQLNAAAAEQYSSTAEIAAALGQFVLDLGSRQTAVREALAALPQLDRQLKLLEAAVGQLNKRSKELEASVGLSGSSSSKNAFEYLASSLSRAGSTVSSVGAAAVGAGACLGGGALPKQ